MSDLTSTSRRADWFRKKPANHRCPTSRRDRSCRRPPCSPHEITHCSTSRDPLLGIHPIQKPFMCSCQVPPNQAISSRRYAFFSFIIGSMLIDRCPITGQPSTRRPQTVRGTARYDDACLDRGRCYGCSTLTCPSWVGCLSLG